jgi:hypothetical protein
VSGCWLMSENALRTGIPEGFSSRRVGLSRMMLGWVGVKIGVKGAPNVAPPAGSREPGPVGARPSRYSSAFARDDFHDYAPPEAVATINHEANLAEVVEGVAH